MSEISHGNVQVSPEVSFINHVQHFLTLAIIHLKQTTDKLVTLSVIYSIISVLAYFLYLLIRRFVNRSQNDSPMKRVLIITAHPDDECMFFGPTILNLRLRNVHVSLLCLSAGDSPPNNKQVRKEELWQSCKVLGLDESNIELRQHSLLKDGHQNTWLHKLISTIILTHIETFDIDTVITFDEQGVSEHPNHMAIFEAMAYLTLNHLLPTNVCFYSLDSVNRLRKYSSMLDFLTSFFVSKYCLILSLTQQYQLVKALACHQSQFVWFRKIYILISRYATINTLKLWSYNELKDCVQYEDMVSGLKKKTMWYKSLDDSLKKINSEQVISVQPDEMSEDQSGPDTEDDDVSFCVKPTPALEQSDPTTRNQTQPVATEQKLNERAVSPFESKPKLVSSEESAVSPVKSKPKLVSSEESIHDGEVFVRCPKSRFLIPKTYRNFYNSSSSSSSDGSVDELATSSGSSKETIMLTSDSTVDKDLIEPNGQENICSDDKHIQINKTESEAGVKNTEKEADNSNNNDDGIKDIEQLDISYNDIDDIEDVNEEDNDESYEIKDIEQLDISYNDIDDIEEDNDESYEIEDIESALNECEKEVILDDVESVLNDCEKDDEGKNNDEKNNTEESSNFDVEKIENIDKVEDIGGSQKHVVRPDNEVKSEQIKTIEISKGKYTAATNTNGSVDKTLHKTKTTVDPHSERKDVFESTQFIVESDLNVKNKCAKNIEKKSEETTASVQIDNPSSNNSSEQESEIVKTEQEESKRNNKRNRKRRKNKKQNNKRESSDDADQVNNKLSLKDELNIAEANRLTNKPPLEKQDEIDIQEANKYIGPNKSTFEKMINSDKDIQEANKYIGETLENVKYIGPNKSTLMKGEKKDVINGDKKDGIFDRNDDQVDIVNSDEKLGENNQNIFNVELVEAISNNNVVDESNSGILQSVSTN